MSLLEGTEETSVLPAAEGSFICLSGKLMKIKRHSEENWLDGWTYMGTLQANAASAEGGEAEAVEEEEEEEEAPKRGRGRRAKTKKVIDEEYDFEQPEDDEEDEMVSTSRSKKGKKSEYPSFYFAHFFRAEY